MPVETRWVAVGRPAFDALAEVVDAAKAGDPMRPVTVITPTPAAAVSLRRGLARHRGGIGVVSFQSLDSVAEQLAAPRLGAEGIVVGVDRELVVAAVRAELDRAPGRFGPIAHHRSTWESLARTVVEVAALDDDERAAVAAAGELPAEVVRLHDSIAGSVGVGGRGAVLRTACERVRSAPEVLKAFGPVVVHLPGRLDRRSVDLLRAIGTYTELVLLGGLSGHRAVDRPVIDAVQDVGGAPPDDREPAAATATQVITTNDIDDEIRAAVRALLAHAEAGHPLHTMALVHPAGAPYTRAVAEVLRTTGIPFSGPSTETLGHRAPGRVVLGLLDVAAHGFARQAVVDLWSSGLLVGADGRPVPAVVLDERTRRLGIVGGRVDWHERLIGRRRWLAEHPPDPPDPSDSEETHERRAARRARELEELDAIDASLAAIEALLDGLPSDWTMLGEWVARVLDTLCGPLTRRTGWPTHEVEADTAIRTVMGRMAALAAVEASPSPATVVETIRSALDTPAPRRSSSGSGLLVTTIDQPPVVPLTAVAVLGLAEGHVPRLGRDDVLLSEAVRRAAALPLPDDATVDQHRALFAALASGTDLRLLTYARCDQRTGRTQVPSRWLVDAIEDMTGGRPRTEALITGRPVPGVHVVESHSQSMRAASGGAALHEDEHRLAALAAADDFDAHPAARDVVVATGSTLVRSRAADAFTRFDGNLAGDGVDVLADDQRHLSPTGIETYASCPRKWFFRHGLGVGDVDRPEEIDRLQARDKGTLAHLILERFIGEAIAAGTVPSPGESWGAEGDARLLSIAAEEFADFERRGLTGHPRWWAYDRDEIVQVLLQTLRHDDELRAAEHATPTAVELTFGRDGVEPLRVTLDDGRVVPIAGQADRVDDVPGGVMVHDYKYASSGPYRGLDRSIDDGGDPLEGGRRLQLLAYAEAAAQQRGIDRASAWYWFLRPGHTGVRIGYEIGPEHRHLFRQTLRVLVDGVGAGLYPARSGPDDWFLGTNRNCGYCDFNEICPADREEEWERVRADPSLSDVTRLAEQGAPAFLVTARLEDDPS